MLQLRNLLFAVLALVVVISFTAQAGQNVVTNQDGSIVAVYQGSAKAGAGTLDCSTLTLCTFFRDSTGQDPNAPAILVTVAVDNTTVSVEADLFAASRCGPDVTMPDFTISGNLTLPMAGTWILFGRPQIPAGTTFSQRWQVGDVDTSITCPFSYCVNSNAGAASADCDNM